MSKIRNLQGRRFGALVVVHRAFAPAKPKRNILWLCKCDCGQEVVVRSDWLLLARKKACAINGHFWATERSKTYGITRKYPSEYLSWEKMRARCLNPKHHHYKIYGGRGITICERWNDFAKFFEDMGPKPTPQHTIDRKDVHGNYEPWNCRWATRKEQCRNTTKTVYVEYQGKRMTLVTLVEELGLRRPIVYGRLKAGWSLEAALAIPVKKYKSGTQNQVPKTYICPVTQLYSELTAAGFTKFAARVANGEFDATKEEGDEWARSPSGQRAAKLLPPEMREFFGLKLNN